MYKQKFREIQILLHRQSGSSNKEMRRILEKVPVCPTFESLLSTFSLLFGLAKYSNREMTYFLDVFLRFASIDKFSFGGIGDRIVDLKFIPSEKDTDSAILKYFEVINFIIDDISLESSRSVLSRYTFMLCNNVVSKAVFSEVFRRFKEFLGKREYFLRMFINRKMYRDIAYTEEFVIDLCESFSVEEMVDAALECEALRSFIIDHTRSKYLFQTYHSALPAWYMAGMHVSLFPYLYYAFDRLKIYKNVSGQLYRELNSSRLVGIIDEDLADTISEEKCDVRPIGDMSQHSNTLVCESEYGDSPGIEEDVKLFNETGSPQHLFDRFDKSLAFEILRYSEDTDLKQLGIYLCKLKNEPELRIFTNTFNFLNMELLDGLRTYLLSFHLLGEGQIIHRVVEMYAERYYLDNADASTFMEISKDEKTREFIFNLSFSFLVLNTKFHNSNIKVKPTFKDYMKDFTADEIPASFNEEYLESMFLSIKKNQLEFPTRNKPTKEHYKVFKKICHKLDKCGRESEYASGCGEDPREELVDLAFTEDLTICSFCRLEAHRRLFSLNFTRFLSLDPEVFYLICNKLRLVRPFEEYLTQSRDDVYKFIESFIYYLRMDGRVELYIMLFEILPRIEKRKSTGMFSDLSISFLKSSSVRRERILPQYKSIYSDLVDAEVSDVGLVCDALKLYLSQPPAQDSGSPNPVEEDGSAQQKRTQRSVSFINSVVLDILEKNIERLGDLSMLNDESLTVLLEKCVWMKNQEKFCQIARFMSYENLLVLFKKIFSESLEFVDDKILEEFKRIPVYNDDGFRCILLLQNGGIDMFDFVVTVKYESIICRAINAKEMEQVRYGEEGSREKYCDEEANAIKVLPEDSSRLEFTEKDTLDCYSIKEKYEECLGDSSNLFHFYISSSSIVNQSKARSIHKSGCPLTQALFSPEEIDRRLIYMIKKADLMNNRDITNYALWIVNLLSSSLPLLAKFFVRNFGLLLTLKDQTMVNNFIKIFYSRICKVITGSNLCCSCGYSSLNDVEALIDLLLKYDLAVEKDFEFYFNGRREQVEKGKIKCNDGDMVLVGPSDVGTEEARNEKSEENPNPGSIEDPNLEKDLVDRAEAASTSDFHL